MKLLRCNGKELEVRDCGPVICRLSAADVPLKFHGWHLLGDDEAREVVRELARAAGARVAGGAADG